MEKKKNVTIPEELFIDLVKYFLADIRCDEDRIRSRLQEKLEAMVKREVYTPDIRRLQHQRKERRQDKSIWRKSVYRRTSDGDFGLSVITISWHEIVCTAE